MKARIIIIFFFIIVGIILVIMLAVKLYSTHNNTKNNNNSVNLNTGTTNVSFYPISGKETATMDKPIKAYLDPLKSFTRIEGSGDAKFIFESDKTKSFICNEKPGTESGHIQDWWAMPAGNYLIYPVGVPKIVFSWKK